MSATKGDATTPVAASIVLQRLHDQVPVDHFTLGWLLAGLSRHSFGILLLLLSVIAIAPGVYSANSSRRFKSTCFSLRQFALGAHALAPV
jgi:hypothetical protein